MKTDLHPCYILHARPYRETSLLLDVFSSAAGRVGLVARGVKRGKGRLAPVLQPARRLNLSWSMRGELGTLIAAETDGPPPVLAGTRLIACFYINELLTRVLHRHEPLPELYGIYDRSVIQLAAGIAEDRVLRIFEKHLLGYLGYGLILDHDVITGHAVEPDRRYFYRPDRGPSSQAVADDLAIPVDGRTLLALDQETDWDDTVVRQARTLFRQILAAYTGEKPLGSRELYRAYLQKSQTA